MKTAGGAILPPFFDFTVQRIYRSGQAAIPGRQERKVEDMILTGSCLCKSVTLSADALPRLQACHCSMCRKWVGGPFLAVPCTGAVFEGPVKRYQSSDGFERGFCTECGSSLYFHPQGSDLHGIPYGLFDGQPDLPFKAEFFIEQKPACYAFADETRKMTGEEFETKFRSR